MDELQQQLDRALRPDAVSMPHEYERQAAALAAHQAESAHADPVVLRMKPRKTMAWMRRGDLIAIAACLLLAGGLGFAVWYAMQNPPPSPNPYVVVPGLRDKSPLTKLPADSIGAILRHFREKENVLGVESATDPDAVVLSMSGPDDEVPRIFDAPRRGIPLSDSARQLGLE